MGSWCGTSPSSTTSTSTAAPQWVQDQFQGTSNIANSLANRGPDQLPQQPHVAGLTGDQSGAIGSFQGANVAGASGLPQASADYASGSTGLAGNAGYRPQQVGGASAGLSLIDPNSVPTVTAGSFPGADLNSYMNPFLQNVADTSLKNLNRQNQIALSNVGSQAETQGAYGGARQGLAEGETNRAYADTGASLLANLFGSGFTQAQNQISTDQNRALSADQGNQGTAFGIQNANAGYSNSNSALNAQLAQQAALANQNAGLTANAQGIGANNDLINGSTTGIQNAITGAGSLFGAGSAEQQLNQGNLNVDYGNAQNLYNLPAQNLSLRLAGQGQSPLAYGSTTTQPVYSNPLGTAAGLGLGAASLFSKGGLFG